MTRKRRRKKNSKGETEVIRVPKKMARKLKKEAKRRNVSLSMLLKTNGRKTKKK